jgi:uncharacterized protein with PIN domain
VPDADVLRRAAAERRVLLTRDRRLADSCAAIAACYRVRATAPLAQLAEVADAFGLAPLALRFTRCLLCNAGLRPVGAAAVPAGVRPPSGVPLWACPACGRVYWEGSHTRRMRAALARAVPGAAGGHAACSPTPPQPPPENHMSGSPGNTSAGTKGGRTPRDDNHDITARHGDDLAHGVRHSDATDAEASARGTRTGEQDSNRQDPDDPANRHENISES